MAGLDNDTRGWIMTCISGLACCLGACIICVDVFVRLIPGMRNFKIAESDAFLSASLSLSFGVMLFSSLFSMLPQSKNYLEDAGFSASAASYLLIGLFLAGIVGIQSLSRALHHCIPSHVVDCDHTHDDEEAGKLQEEMAEHQHDDTHTKGLPIVKFAQTPNEVDYEDDDETPLLSRINSISPPKPRTTSMPASEQTNGLSENGFITAPSSRRPSLMPRVLSKTLSKLTSTKKSQCDETGPCMGYSDPCGQECFTGLSRRGTIIPSYGGPLSRSGTIRGVPDSNGAPPVSEDGDARNSGQRSRSDGRSCATTAAGGRTLQSAPRSRSATHHYHHPENEHVDPHKRDPGPDQHSIGPEHHHHVPTNAFLSIGLQTSIAIALHKMPEGFITYATNHANPTLGLAVFMALFIHNITEGFAMSLPLYLAIGSRWKAIFWSSLLGGVSQPLGAGVAALWFKLAQHSDRGAPGAGVYGGMFAVTSGVMTSVALNLFSESLQLSHNRNTCVAFAFLGMGILGFSFALTAK